jgi:hypothetical protein
MEQYADNVNARNKLVDRLQRARDATENAAEVTREQIGKYGEGILDAVHVLDAFQNAVENIPSGTHRRSTPRPSAPTEDAPAIDLNSSPSDMPSPPTSGTTPKQGLPHRRGLNSVPLTGTQNVVSEMREVLGLK